MLFQSSINASGVVLRQVVLKNDTPKGQCHQEETHICTFTLWISRLQCRVLFFQIGYDKDCIEKNSVYAKF